ncbi:MFS transporter [Pedobacter sp. Hv1]|uniref:MFS transporter n=1 Tax=Pedobacter sp. Hv1 TaxID=1740090 RepID=UPI0006D8B55B|nr:MFS transporter [Pedobacter sp. Hv1]KQC00441.1 MFS transporter [Pedobacter sp. Hv1]
MFQQIIQAYKTSFSGLSKETWLLSIVILVNRCGYMAVPFMGLYVTKSLHRPASDAGIIISLFGVGSILGATAGGKLTDMFGFRPVQIFSSLIGGLFFLVFSQVSHFNTLCVLAVLISFFCDAFRPANFTAIAAYAAEGKETRSYSLNRLATNIGWAVGISIGGIIASFNYQLLFIVDGVVSILVAFAIFMFLPAVKGFRKAVAAKLEGIIVRKPWQDPLFIKFLLLTTVFATCFFLMFRVVPVFFKEVWHLDEALIGMVLGVNGVIIALFEMVMISKIENKRSPVFYIVTGVLIVGLSFATLMLPKFLPVVVALISVTCFTFGEMFAIPFVNTFVIKRSNEFNRGQYAAGYTVAWSIAQVVGPTGGFYLAEKLGYSPLWICIVVLLLFCAYGYSTLNLSEDQTPVSS